MVTDFVRPESMEVPEGGLASFLTATVGEWAEATQDDIPQTGIAGVKSVADQLADYGRYEDTYIVHAAEGETVIPMAVLDRDPRLKEILFTQMRSMGLEPERYVVGNELNSINPVTGQPEFSIFSGFFKGLKRAVKGVVKVFKTLAPIVLSVGLSTVMGPIAGTALGSGIGTLIQGGSFKDALKMAAIGGATVGLFKGLQGSWQGMKPGGAGIVGGFQEGVASGMPGAASAAQAQAAIEQAAANQPKLIPGATAPSDIEKFLAKDPLLWNRPTSVTAQAMGTGAVDPNLLSSLPKSWPAIATSTPGDLVSMTQGGINTSAFGLGAPAGAGAAGAAGAAPAAGSWNIGDPIPKMPTVGGAPAPTPRSGSFNINQQTQPSYAWDPLKDMPTGEWQLGSGGGGGGATGASPFTPDRGFTTEFTDIFKSGNRGPFEAAKQAFFPSDIDPTAFIKDQLGLDQTATVADIVRVGGKSYYQQLAEATAEINARGLNPGMFRKYLPLAAAGYGLLGGTGGFEEGEEEPPEDPFGMGGKTAMELVQENPAKYRVFSQGAPYSVPTGAHGGDVKKGCCPGCASGGECIVHRNTGGNFPPRDGAISGPGTGTSDDIRAMLSDGEFVMTADAVRGAGNGDRRRGVKKMYEVMRGFEGVA